MNWRAPLAAILFLCAGPAQSQTTCKPDSWFDLELAALTCPLATVEGGRDSLVLSLPYNTDSPNLEFDDNGSLDVTGTRSANLQLHEGNIAVQAEMLAEDLATVRASLAPGSALFSGQEFAAEVPVASFGSLSAIQSLALVFPAGSLSCGNTLVREEIVVAVPISSEDGEAIRAIDCFGTSDTEGSRPFDWQIDAGVADNDADGDSGITLDFVFNRQWGYNFAVDDGDRSWSTNLWRLRIDGSVATNDLDFHDSLRAEFSWAYNRNFVGRGVSDRTFTATWLSAFLRPETTFDGDNRDYVYGVRAGALLNLERTLGISLRGTRPYLALAVENVDPDRRDSGSDPGNYQRARGQLQWKVYPTNALIVELIWELNYLFDGADADALLLDDQLQQRFDLTVSLPLESTGEFRPFLKFTHGETSPTYVTTNEVLLGFLWDFAFANQRRP